MNNYDLSYHETKEQTTRRTDAINAAIWVTASEHEWEWTIDQQVAMARFCIEATNRLCELQQTVDKLESEQRQVE